MRDSTLTREEIMSLSGRIMNTFIQEYVVGDHPTRWSNGQQKELKCHWFEEHPRACAEDDGGFCSADTLPRYSTDISAAMSIKINNKSLSTKTEINEYWATFTEVPFGDKRYSWQNVWASAPTLPLAICRAALLVS